MTHPGIRRKGVIYRRKIKVKTTAKRESRLSSISYYFLLIYCFLLKISSVGQERLTQQQLTDRPSTRHGLRTNALGTSPTRATHTHTRNRSTDCDKRCERLTEAAPTRQQPGLASHQLPCSCSTEALSSRLSIAESRRHIVLLPCCLEPSPLFSSRAQAYAGAAPAACFWIGRNNLNSGGSSSSEYKRSEKYILRMRQFAWICTRSVSM